MRGFSVAYGVSRIGLCVALSMPIAAHAQSADSDPADDSLGNEIVVTAQFREQNLQETPLAITAVNAEMLEARGQTNVSDVANRAPSVTLTTASGGLGGSQATSINIRGIGQTDFNLAVEPGVGMYIDDVYYGTMYGSLFSLVDLDRVEILRGPQGTLSGKNALGGAVKLYSKRPTGSGEGYIDATFGSRNLLRLRAGVDLGLAESLNLRLSGLAESQDGYVTRYDYECRTGSPADENDTIPSLAEGGENGCVIGHEGGREVVALRGALRFEPTSDIDNTVIVDYTRDRSDPAPSVLLFQGDWHGPGFNLLGPPGPNFTADFSVPKGSYYNYSSYCGLIATPHQYCRNPVNRLDTWGVSNNLSIRLGADLSLVSITSYRNLSQSSVKDNDASPAPRGMNGWNVEYEQFTQEVRLSGGIGRIVDWTVGGFYFWSGAVQGGRINLDAATDYAIPFAVPTDFTFEDPVRARSKSGFAHVEVRPVDRVALTAGVRYTKDRKVYGFERDVVPGRTPGIVDASILATDGSRGEFSGSRWDYRLTASYEPVDDIHVYAQFATGFKGGGVNPRPYYVEQILPFDPETVNSYEAGIKTRFLGGAATVNLAAFYNEYSNVQLTLGDCPDLIPPGAPDACYLPANVGSAHIKGIEAEATLEPAEGLLIDASASYLDFQYTEVDPATLVEIGDKPPFTPKFKASGGIQYALTVPSFGKITPRLDVRYQSSQYSGGLNFPEDRIKAYALADARLTFENTEGDWQVVLAAKNLFNKYYATSIGASLIATGSSYDDSVIFNPGPPRELSITVKKLF